MLKQFLRLILILFSVSLAYADDINSPIGYWKTVDDVTGKVQSIIRITENFDHTLSGALVKTFPQPGEPNIVVCEACKDWRHNKLILGMTIITGLKAEGIQWKGGQILDPSTGKSYHCNMRTVDNGAKLHVRGYIGFPLLGRTQTWLRTDKID